MLKPNTLTAFLVEMRKKYDLFTIQKVCSECDVCENTVRNFENGSTFNATVLMYYLAEVSYELKNNSSMLAKKAGVTPTTVTRDLIKIDRLLHDIF